MGPPRARPCPAPQVLRHELAELYSELKKYDQAQAELSQLLDHLEGAADKSLDVASAGPVIFVDISTYFHKNCNKFQIVAGPASHGVPH